jgi:hypothetical protein
MKIILVFLLSMLPCGLLAGDLARFLVKPVRGAGISQVSISLDGLNYNTDSFRIALYESGPGGMTEIESQLESGVSAKLWFLFDNGEGPREYTLRMVAPETDGMPGISFRQDEQSTTVEKKGKPVLSYNHSVIFPPEGVDMKYRRSAFIHPLWSPGGEVLTRIQPPDHYHHYGIWNPWTKTTINGREVDFWNLIKGEGTVKTAGYLDAVQGPVYAGFKVHHEHVFFSMGDREKVAINELWDVRVWESGTEGITVVDLTTTLNTPLENGIMLDAYRYGGGLGFRATENWHRDNCTVLTSEGKTREEADGTGARWSIVEGESSVPEGRSGILFLSHPANRMHPEPMRVWPLNANGGRGDMFFEFCPIRHADWMLDRGQNYTLKYRMVLFDGLMKPEEAEKYWKSFSALPVIEFYD